jgi:transposase
MLLHELDEKEWLLIQDLIPKASSAKELENGVIRASVNAILWRMRTGKSWQGVPPKYGDHTSICRRFVQWREAGVWRDVTITLASLRNGESPSDQRGPGVAVFCGASAVQEES